MRTYTNVLLIKHEKIELNQYYLCNDGSFGRPFGWRVCYKKFNLLYMIFFSYVHY